MARPRRAKTAARKPKKTKATKTPKRRDFTSRVADPFRLDARLIPAGWTYQWAPMDAENPRPGWGAVPFSRHAHDFPPQYQTKFGYIHCGGLILLEAPTEQYRAEIRAPQELAQGWVKDHPALHDHSGGYHPGGGIMPPEWMVSKARTPEEWAKLDFDGETTDVEVPLTVRIPRRWADAAVTCQLDFTEYVRRRILIDRPVLGSMGDAGYEPVVYEPVKLAFTPIRQSSPEETD